MRWSEEVHVQRLVVARRAAGRQAQGISRASKADSSLSRLALVAGSLSNLLYNRWKVLMASLSPVPAYTPFGQARYK